MLISGTLEMREDYRPKTKELYINTTVAKNVCFPWWYRLTIQKLLFMCATTEGLNEWTLGTGFPWMM